MNLRFWQWYVDRIKIIEMVLEELYRQGHEDGEKDVNIFIYFFVYTDGRQIKGKKNSHSVRCTYSIIVVDMIIGSVYSQFF